MGGLIFLIMMVISIKESTRVKEFEANGKIIDINWRSKNHGEPIIYIRQQNNKIKEFKGNQITLTPQNTKIGDDFVKTKNSKYCLINDVNNRLCSVCISTIIAI